ncbi:MAG: class I SAM-dependent methyltransferase [Stellaceae bacterium]
MIDLLGAECRQILDVGCGSGDNAALIKRRFPTCSVDGITRSDAEAALARKHMRDCWVFDIEAGIPGDVRSRTYDAIVFSHVLEHLRDPEKIVADYSSLVKDDGSVLIAVPNIASWRMRGQILRGDFTYTDMGPLDVTHLRFFTFQTADAFLLAASPDLKLQAKMAHGSFPLWGLRRYVLPASLCAWIDSGVCRAWPNLFGEQVILKAIKR